jgi:hypothetical protein
MILRWLLFIGFTVFFTGCQFEKKELDPQLIVREFYTALNNSNLIKASIFIDDNIVASEFQFIQVQSKDEWLTQFKWDSVFNPTYTILELKEVDGKVVATVSKECKRIRFLHDSATIYKVEYGFLDGKIKKDSIFEYLVFDFEKWQSRRDSLVSWVDLNHPDLSGFIYDQTISGGQKYLDAIKFYENEK